MGIQSVFVGERYQNKSGSWYTVTEYITGKKIKVRFDRTGYECLVEGQEIRRGCVVDSFEKYPAVGNKYEMLQNGILEVVEYINTANVIVKFVDTGYTTTVEACQIKRGTVKDNLLPRVCGVGFVGDGIHSPYSKGKQVSWAYLKWQNMLERCYRPFDEIVARIYSGVEVDKVWHNFQNFAEWAKNQVGYGNRNWAMEKDLLVRGNKIYTPNNCCFLPVELNNQIIKSNASRGCLPIGVGLQKSNGKFVAHVSGIGNSGYVGIYETIEEAFFNYKNVKEKRLKYLANKWKSQIDPRAYQALMDYEVLITD